MARNRPRTSSNRHQAPLSSGPHEHLFLETDRRLGLDAASSALSSFEDVPVVVVERYDRAAARIGRADWEQHARRLRLAPKAVLERVERIATATPLAAAESCTFTGADDFAERFAAAASIHQQRCLAAFATTPPPWPRRPASVLGLTCLA